MRAARPRALCAGAFLIQSLFAATVFAGLGAPLLWQDEAETAMLGRGVLEGGVPLVHQGRNIVYGVHHPIELGRNAQLDAYLGSPWAQYYFAAPAVAWSDRSQDLAERTWRVRLPFALAGWIGVMLIGSAAASCWPAAAGSRAAFWLGYGACLAVSVSLQLHLREVRYYPLVVLALGAIAQLEVRRYARGDLSPLVRTLLLAPLLWGLFNLFYPAFAAVVGTASCAFAVRALTSRAPLRERASELARAAAPYALACLAVLPMVAFYRLPAQSRSFYETFGDGDAVFATQLAAAALYLLRFELLVPALLGCLALAFTRRAAVQAGLRVPLAACGVLLVGAALWVALITRTPLFFSRYLVALSPLLAAVSVLAIGCLIALRRSGSPRIATAGLAALAVALAACVVVRAPELRGRLAELREPYRGPLDHVIPYLAERYPRGGDAVIATNYEDVSFMFYLGATTVLGYYAPERERDLEFVPDVIIPRPWARNLTALEWLASQHPYEMHSFPVANLRANNLPELSPLNESGLVHRFRSPEPGVDGEVLVIGERRQP
jgi:hypothetical protein